MLRPHRVDENAGTLYENLQQRYTRPPPTDRTFQRRRGLPGRLAARALKELSRRAADPKCNSTPRSLKARRHTVDPSAKRRSPQSADIEIGGSPAASLCLQAARHGQSCGVRHHMRPHEYPEGPCARRRCLFRSSVPGCVPRAERRDPFPSTRCRAGRVRWENLKTYRRKSRRCCRNLPIRGSELWGSHPSQTSVSAKVVCKASRAVSIRRASSSICEEPPGGLDRDNRSSSTSALSS